MAKILIMLLAAAALNGQFLPGLQAESEAEYDAYLDILDAQAARGVVEAAERFVARWPSSDLLLHVYEIQAEAYRQLGLGKEALAAGERGLNIAPRYIPLLAATADIEANIASDAQGLKRAEARGRLTLDLLKDAKAPVRVSIAEWKAACGLIRVRANDALGLAAYRKGKTQLAIAFFEQAIQAGAVADPAICFRLGKLLAAEGRTSEAAMHFREAAKTADPDLRGRALGELQVIEGGGKR